MYDPKIARFLQEDTYLGDPNDPLSLNLYTYCHNEPIMYWDPSGNTEREMMALINGYSLAEYDRIQERVKTDNQLQTRPPTYYSEYQRKNVTPKPIAKPIPTPTSTPIPTPTSTPIIETLHDVQQRKWREANDFWSYLDAEWASIEYSASEWGKFLDVSPSGWEGESWQKKMDVAEGSVWMILFHKVSNGSLLRSAPPTVPFPNNINNIVNKQNIPISADTGKYILNKTFQGKFNLKKTYYTGDAKTFFTNELDDTAALFGGNNKRSVNPIKIGQPTSRPVFKIYEEEAPNHVRMIRNAQAKGEILTDLTKVGSVREANRNRFLSQRVIRKEQGPPAKGFNYDEFPYASTKEGGIGAHVELVPEAENKLMGNKLLQFYKKHKLKEWDVFDIEIVPRTKGSYMDIDVDK